jgi:uncharacterized C2H2 Zn-finger protein
MNNINYLFILCGLIIFSCKPDYQVFVNNDHSWSKYGDAKWKIENAELIATVYEGDGWLATDSTYENFILELDFYPSSEINSGVFIRCKDTAIDPDICYELNIWDAHTIVENRTGALVRRARPYAHINTINKWNTYRIEANGIKLKAWINDTLTIDVKNSELTSGHVGLQAKGTGEIKFRNIRITPTK